MRILHPDIWEDEEDFEDSVQVMLGEVFSEHQSIAYEYDFGDGWEHIIRLKRVIEDCTEPWPRCIQAIGDAPLEDCGGPEGYARLLEILRNPKHPEYEETAEWLGEAQRHPLDVAWLNYRLKLAWRRRIPRYF